MLVVTISMWPGGDAARAYTVSLATLACLGQATRDDAALGVHAGERAYEVKLYKDTSFGGPAALEPRARCRGAVWRSGRVHGHFPGKRGGWDLLGGALQALLGVRLRGYAPLREAAQAELHQGDAADLDGPAIGSRWRTESFGFRVVGQHALRLDTSDNEATPGTLLAEVVVGVLEDGAGVRRGEGSMVLFGRGRFGADLQPWTPGADILSSPWTRDPFVPTAYEARCIRDRLLSDAQMQSSTEEPRT